MMRTRRGFARSMALAVVAGIVAAASIAMLPGARPIQSPAPVALANPPAPPAVDQVRVVVARECWMEDSGVLHYPGERRARCVLSLAGAGLWVDTTFPDPPVRCISLERSDLYGVDLGATDLRGANIRGARLRGCNFSAARLTGADLRGATYDQDTRWPCPAGTRFDPKAHGARFVRTP